MGRSAAWGVFGEVAMSQLLKKNRSPAGRAHAAGRLRDNSPRRPIARKGRRDEQEEKIEAMFHPPPKNPPPAQPKPTNPPPHPPTPHNTTKTEGVAGPIRFKAQTPTQTRLEKKATTLS